MLLFFLAALVFTVVAVVWLGYRSYRPPPSPPSPPPRDTSGDEEWARNFEAASERMEHEVPDPPDP